MNPTTLLPLGALALDAQAWRYRGRTRLTVVAKISFALPEKPTAGREARGPLAVCDPDPLAGRERGEASELAPYLPRGEGVLVGSAYVPRGDRVASRFGVARSGAMMFDRRIWATAPQSMEALVRVPLVHDASSALSDVRDPKAPHAFAPMAHPLRGHVGELIDLEDEVIWDSFLVSPPTQRAPGFFFGDETLLLEHVSPRVQRFEVTLPGARVEARVHDGQAGEPFALVGDHLRVEPDRGRVTLTFRASVPLSADREVKVAARLLVAGREAPAWPANDKAWAPRAAPRTEALRMEEPPQALPFAGANQQTRAAQPAAPVPGAPFGAPAAPAPPVPEGEAISTLELPTPKRRPQPGQPAPPAAVAAPVPVAPPAPVAPAPPAQVVPASVGAAAMAPGHGRAKLPAAPPGLAEFGLLPLGAAPSEAPPPRRAAADEPTPGAILIRTLLAEIEQGART